MTPCVTVPVGKGSRYPRKKINGRFVQRSRLVYCEHYGVTLESLAGLVVRHKCDNPACINPEHLELGTQRDNGRDMAQRGRASRHGTQNAGAGNGMAKLTQGTVDYIRSVCIKGHPEFGVSALARRFGVWPAAVSSIVRGKAWTLKNG